MLGHVLGEIGLAQISRASRDHARATETQALLTGLRDRFGSTFVVFVGEQPVDLTLRDCGQTTHKTDKSFEIY